MPLLVLDDPIVSSPSHSARSSVTAVGSPTAPDPTGGLKGEKFRLIEVFAGVGGLTLGAARAGFEITLAVDKDVHALRAHKLNFPKMSHLDADVTALDGTTLLAAAGLKAGELDGLIGGPPCQGFSMIGRRKTTDSRNTLFQKFFELVAQTRPKFFVAENVPGILTEAYDDIREGALNLVRGNYRMLAPMRLRASDFGAPTIRERVFFIGYRTPLTLTETHFQAGMTTEKTRVREALAGLPRVRSAWLQEAQGWRRVGALPKGLYGDNISGNIPDGVGDKDALRLYQAAQLVSGCLGTMHSDDLRTRYGSLKAGEQDRKTKSTRLKNDGFCPTLRAGTDSDKGSFQAVRPIHPTAPRVITPREAARLQGFPDWFRFAPSKWHSFRQIGNSISPFVAEAVLKTIHDNLSNASQTP